MQRSDLLVSVGALDPRAASTVRPIDLLKSLVGGSPRFGSTTILMQPPWRFQGAQWLRTPAGTMSRAGNGGAQASMRFPHAMQDQQALELW